MTDHHHDLPPLPRVVLTPRQWATFAAHGFKATAQQHHRQLAAIFRTLIADDAVVFDAGAHAGQFAKLFARMASRGVVYAFEPARYARAVLMLSMAFNRPSNIKVFPLALGASPGRLVLRTPIKRSGSFGFGLAHIGEDESPVRPETVETIDVVTIDGFCTFMGIDRLDFIKGDIEGWELQMLKGGTATLERFRPCVWIEVVGVNLARAGDSVEGLWQFMTKRAYEAFMFADGGQVRRLGAPESGDILWVPSERAGALSVC